MPGFPTENVQRHFTSRSREEALDEAFKFFRLVKEACGRYDEPLRGETRLLDFGVGWGRIVRTFMKDVAGSNIFGVDVNDHILSVCRELVPWGTYLRCRHGERLAFEDGTFDLLTEFSVLALVGFVCLPYVGL